MFNLVYATILLFLVNLCHHDQEKPEPNSVTLQEEWATDTVLKTPESVLYYPLIDKIFVSNINGEHEAVKDGDGFLSILSSNGKIENLKWVTGLNDPKGLGVWGNKLFVADIKEVAVIDIISGSIIKKISIPGSIFLNDITVDKYGKVYVSDTYADKIFLIEEGVSVFKEGDEIKNPNGLLAEKDQLIVTTINTSEVKRISNPGKVVTPFANGITFGDGIAKDNYQNYFVSAWEGQVFYVKSSGEKQLLLDTKSSWIMAADIDFIKDKKLLLVPTFYNNRVVAYKALYKWQPS